MGSRHRRALLSVAAAAMLVAVALFWLVWAPSRTQDPVDATVRIEDEGDDSTDAPRVTGTDASRQVVAGDDSATVTVLDERSAPVADASIELLALSSGARSLARTTLAGKASVLPGKYVVWIHGEGLVDHFGACVFAGQITLQVARESRVVLLFTEEGQPRSGVRAKLLLESPSNEEENILGLERSRLRETCFERGLPADRLRALADALGTKTRFGWVCDVQRAERTSDAAGSIAWDGMPAGTYRWQLLSGERVAFDPPYEVGAFTETPDGRLEINATRRDLSGAFRVSAGATVTLTGLILRSCRVTGVVLAEGDRPVQGARVTLRTVARSQSSNDMATAPEAHARTSDDGTFAFDNLSPGEKIVFAILDESKNHHFWVSNDAREFTLAEGEQRDVGVLSMAGATVEISARLVGSGGSELALEDVVEEHDTRARLLLTNGIQPRKGFSTSLWMRIGASEVYTLHGLSPLVEVLLSSGEVAADGTPWTLKRGFLEDPSAAIKKRFDPFAEPQVVLDIPIEEVVPCAMHLALPAGCSLAMQTNLHGEARRRSDRRRFSVSIPSNAAGGFEGEVELPPGSYEILLTTALPPQHAGFFARGRIEVPCTSRLELGLERAVVISGLLVDAAGAPVQRGSLRVGFSGMRAGECGPSSGATKAGASRSRGSRRTARSFSRARRKTCGSARRTCAACRS